MKKLKWDWKTSDGLKIHSQGWLPDKKMKGVVCLAHGHGEHSGRYANVGEALSKAGYALLGMDLRGHGISEGPRGHTPSLDILLDDLDLFLKTARQRFPGVPCFFYGHSMGGTLILNFLLRRKEKVAGAVVTGAWIRLSFKPSSIKVLLGKVMNNLVPGFSQPSGLEIAALSRDPKVVRAYKNDPLVHDTISARLFMAITESGEWALEHAADFRLPLLLMQGSADRIVSVPAIEEFAKRAGKKVTLKTWDGWYHEIHNEPEQAKVFKAMTEWLDRHIK